MQNPLKRKPKPYPAELRRLMDILADLQPTQPEYQAVLDQIDHLDKLNNRATEMIKTVVPAIGTMAGVAGIYALQQFGGVIVPKALEALASHSSKKNPQNEQ